MQAIDQRQMLPIGAVLDNRYRIIKYLASGGFGNTYVAEDNRLGGEVAIKEFFMRGTNHRSEDGTTVDVSNAENQALFDSQLGKFKREAARIFKLRNDHIIHVFDLFDANGTSYYVMDLVKGTSLSAVVHEHPMPEAEARDAILQVLDALKAIHANGLYHLDIKPGNIMRDADGHCTLIDFGASKQLTADERSTYSSSTMAYTPGYAAIEQIAQQTKNIGPWTDLYALGATFYCLLTGNRPPEVEADDMAPDGRQFPYPDEVSVQSRRAIAAMMNPSRRLRPQNADEVIALLEDDATMVLPGKVKPQESVEEETQVLGARPDAPAGDDTIRLPAQNLPPSLGNVENSPIYDEEEEHSSKTFIYVLLFAGLAGLFVWYYNSRPQEKEAPAAAVTESPASVELAAPAEEEIKEEEPKFDPVIQNLIDNMVDVSGGTFTMGATSEQGEDALDDEYPTHRVTLSSFSIGRYEVTQEEWKAVMGSNPSEFKGAKRPVENVSWDDCQKFIRKLNEMTGKNFRLPTEAEWEFAARGGNHSRGYKYAGGNSIGSVAWYDENSGEQTHNVGTKSPNELGLYDMAGNVWEWCRDWYGDYSLSSQSNPKGPSSDSFRVIRGGSWTGVDGSCRVTYRDCLTPDFSGYSLGFRLAL